MKQQRTTENYLKVIYLLSKMGEVHGTDIADRLGVTRPTVSVSLKALEREGFLYLDKNKAVHLTDDGEKIAKGIYEKNKTLESFLLRLGVSSDTAAKDACEMEHAVSSESFVALKRMIESSNR